MPTYNAESDTYDEDDLSTEISWKDASERPAVYREERFRTAVANELRSLVDAVLTVDRTLSPPPRPYIPIVDDGRPPTQHPRAGSTADTARLNWLANDPDHRFADVIGLMNNEEGFADVRAAIDEMIRRQG